MHLPTRSHVRLPLILGIILLLAFGLVGTAQAFEFPPGELIDQGTVINDDAFLTANLVQIDGTVNGIVFVNSSTTILNGTINGDLVVMSARVEINGVVNGNLIASGQMIQVNGQVTGSAFVLSSTLLMGSQARIDRNLYMMGYCVETQPGSQIGIDVTYNGYQMLLNGQVGRDLMADVVAFDLTGSVGRDLQLAVMAPVDEKNFMTPPFFGFLEGPDVPAPRPDGLRIAPQASIGGELNYASTVEQSAGIQAGQMPTKVTFTQAEDPESAAMVRRIFFQNRLHELITLLVLGGLALWLIPGPLSRAAEQLRRPLPALGRGILVTLLAYLALAAFLLLTIGATIFLVFVNLKGISHITGWVGIPGLVLALAAFTVLAAYGSKLVVATMVGRWIFQRLRPNFSGQAFWPLLAGILLYALVGAIPVMPLHLLYQTLVIVTGIGAIWLAYRARQPQAEALKTESQID